MQGFDRFWQVWPSNSQTYTRKGCKAEFLKRWQRHHHETQADTIIAHVAWLRTTMDWLKDGGAYIPAPLVYLNQARWDGADIPKSPEQVSVDHDAVYQRQLAASIRAMNGGK